MIGRCGLVFCLLTIIPWITLLKRTFWYCNGEFWKIIPLFLMWCIWRETFEGCELPYEVKIFVLKVSLWLDNGCCFIIFYKNFVTFWFFEFKSLIWCSFVSLQYIVCWGNVLYCTFIVKYITQLLWKKCVLQVQTANLVLLPLWSCSGTELCFWISVCRSAMTGVRVLKIRILPQQRPIFSYIYHRLFFHYFLMEPLLR